jgi:uracil phosphoribosyltransferase
MIRLLGQSHSLLNQFVAEIRDVEIQRDSLRFRNNLERIGEIFAYEISKELAYEEKEVVTSLGIANVPVLTQYPVLATILRAGLPFHQGFLKFFDRSSNAFVSAYRMAHKDGTFSMSVDYLRHHDCYRIFYGSYLQGVACQGQTGTCAHCNHSCQYGGCKSPEEVSSQKECHHLGRRC